MSHNAAPTWQEHLDRAIDRRFETMVAIRRKLHAQPEPSGEELETSLFLYQSLRDEGFAVRLGPEGRGVLADMPLQKSPSTIQDAVERVALRADIDALRIHDAKTVEYHSQKDGLMHACGHDAHTAIVFGALTALNDLRRDRLLPCPAPVRGVFQPAEETAEGARAMVEAGALETVGAIFASHVDPSRTIGRIGLRSGVLTANCDAMSITLTGLGGHAARPHETTDPVAAAAQLINAIYLYIPRMTDSQDSVVVTFGQIIAGDNANVIPEQVVLRGTLRTLDAEVRRRTVEHIRRLSAGMAQATDTQVKVELHIGVDSVRNDVRMTEFLRQAGAEVCGAGGIDPIRRPSMGSEDFACYLTHVPGAMMRLGCVSERVGGAPLHSPSFDIDEEALRIGARVLARAAVCWCQEHPS